MRKLIAKDLCWRVPRWCSGLNIETHFEQGMEPMGSSYAWIGSLRLMKKNYIDL